MWTIGRKYTKVLLFSVIFVALLLSTRTLLYEKAQILETVVPVTLQDESTECHVLRKTYMEQVSEIQKQARLKRIHLPGWTMGTGVSLLTKGCMTAQQRYAPYMSPMVGTERLLECNRKVKRNQKPAVFGIRISEKQSYVLDFQRFLRSVVAELGWNLGIDVALLVYAENKQQFNVSQVPKEFQSLLRVHDNKDVVEAFPKLTVFKDPNFQLDGYPPVALYGHASALWLMKTQPQYEYLWVIESDIRATGTWDTILHHLGRNHDFVTPFPTEKTDPAWMWSTDRFEVKDLYNGLQCFFGISRQYATAAEQELALENNAFLEVFLPSVAHKHGLTSQYAAFPVFEQPNTNYPLGWKDKSSIPAWVQVKGVYQEKYQHRRTFDITYPQVPAPEYYEDWNKDLSFCTPATILHPIKV
jgi:hypothetical protein